MREGAIPFKISHTHVEDFGKVYYRVSVNFYVHLFCVIFG